MEVTDAFGLAVWLIAASLTFAAGTALLVAAGLAWLFDEGRIGTGCRCGGCRRMPAVQGCRTTPAVDGPAAGDFGTLARAGWVDVDVVRRWEGSTWR